MPMDEKIELLIDHYNEVKAQNLAMNHALAGILSIWPKEFRDAAAEQYDLRCATHQVVVNDGRTELDALAIQREQFAIVRGRVFRDPIQNQTS